VGALGSVLGEGLMNLPPHGKFTLRAALCAVCLGSRQSPRLVVVLPPAISAALRFAGGDGGEAEVELVFPAELAAGKSGKFGGPSPFGRFEAGFAEGVVAEPERSGDSPPEAARRASEVGQLGTGVAFGVGGELMRWLQDDHWVSIGLNQDLGKGRFGGKRRRSSGELCFSRSLEGGWSCCRRQIGRIGLRRLILCGGCGVQGRGIGQSGWTEGGAGKNRTYGDYATC